jgi:hypothetical protein
LVCENFELAADEFANTGQILAWIVGTTTGTKETAIAEDAGVVMTEYVIHPKADTYFFAVPEFMKNICWKAYQIVRQFIVPSPRKICCEAYRNILQSGLGPFYLDEETVESMTYYWIKFRSLPQAKMQEFVEFSAAHPEMPKLHIGGTLPFQHCPWCGARKYWGP